MISVSFNRTMNPALKLVLLTWKTDRVALIGLSLKTKWRRLPLGAREETWATSYFLLNIFTKCSTEPASHPSQPVRGKGVESGFTQKQHGCAALATTHKQTNTGQSLVSFSLWAWIENICASMCLATVESLSAVFSQDSLFSLGWTSIYMCIWMWIYISRRACVFVPCVHKYHTNAHNLPQKSINPTYNHTQSNNHNVLECQHCWQGSQWALLQTTQWLT